MTDRILKVTLEGTYGLPHEIAKKNITIVRHANGEYFSKYTSKNEKLEKVSVKRKLDVNEVDRILATLAMIHIPAFPEHEMGCDGGFTEIEIGGYSGKSHFRWWSVPPDGWEKLDEIVQRIVTLSGVNNT